MCGLSSLGSGNHWRYHCNQIAGYICITIGYNQLFNQNAKSSHTDTCSTNLLTNSLIFINIHRNTLYITNHITIILIHTTSYIRVFFMLLANLEIAYRGIVFFVVQLRYVCFLCFWLISMWCFSTKHITNNVFSQPYNQPLTYADTALPDNIILSLFPPTSLRHPHPKALP